MLAFKLASETKELVAAANIELEGIQGLLLQFNLFKLPNRKQLSHVGHEQVPLLALEAQQALVRVRRHSLCITLAEF